MAKDCFIIMPISTSKDIAAYYKGDEKHFSHVLEHLFIPAIKAADLKPIPPITRGSEVIQGEIIKNLETAELVLVDMSILNPNVFFEMGIRTALNKPVSLLKDSKTDKIPFDTSIINYHTYSASLELWEIDKEIEKLTKHIKECAKKKNENSLWKYFSLSTIAEPVKEQEGVEGKVEQLSMEIMALRKQIDEQSLEESLYTGKHFIPRKTGSIITQYRKGEDDEIESAINLAIKDILIKNGRKNEEYIFDFDRKESNLVFLDDIPNKVKNDVMELFLFYGIPVKFNFI